MAVWDSLYCTDEDVALRAAGDFAQLLVKPQTVARGNDGTLDPADGWLLRSAVPFAAAGIAPGHVMVLRWGPKEYGSGTGAGTLWGVRGPEPGGLRLRTLGEDDPDAPAGMPPEIPAGGPFPFAAPTVRGLIRRATFDLNFAYQIRSPADLIDPTQDFRAACELLVYMRLLLTYAQGGPNRDAWLEKYRLIKLDWESITAALDAEYGPATGRQAPEAAPMDPLPSPLLGALWGRADVADPLYGRRRVAGGWPRL